MLQAACALPSSHAQHFAVQNWTTSAFFAREQVRSNYARIYAGCYIPHQVRYCYRLPALSWHEMVTLLMACRRDEFWSDPADANVCSPQAQHHLKWMLPGMHGEAAHGYHKQARQLADLCCTGYDGCTRSSDGNPLCAHMKATVGACWHVCTFTPVSTCASVCVCVCGLYLGTVWWPLSTCTPAASAYTPVCTVLAEGHVHPCCEHLHAYEY